MAIVFWNVASCSVYHHPRINLNLLVLVKGSHKHFKILRKIVVAGIVQSIENRT